jgi:hypothetical protein
VGGQHEANVNLVVAGHDGEVLVEFVGTCDIKRQERICVLRDWVLKLDVLVKLVALVLCIQMFLVSNLGIGYLDR